MTSRRVKYSFNYVGKVITENRGIYTNPPRPDSFGRFETSYPKDLKKKPVEEIIPFRKREKPQYKASFKPAALQKCDPFCSDKNVYSPPVKTYLSEKEKSMEVKNHFILKIRKKGREKFKKEKSPGSIEHVFAFKPCGDIKEGIPGFFGKPNEVFGGYPYIQYPKNSVKNIREHKKPFKESFK